MSTSSGAEERRRAAGTERHCHVAMALDLLELGLVEAAVSAAYEACEGPEAQHWVASAAASFGAASPHAASRLIATILDTGTN